jgi:hypothetical protein
MVDLSIFITCWEFPDQQTDCQLLKNSAPQHRTSTVYPFQQKLITKYTAMKNRK